MTDSTMLPTAPQPHQVESTMPRTSPIAQPVRPCSVALTAVDQEDQEYEGVHDREPYTPRGYPSREPTHLCN